MNYKENTIGGGPARGLADDFTKFLQGIINTGSFGAGTAGQQTMAANPFQGTQNVMSVLNGILQGPSSAAIGGLQELISNQTTNDVNALRSRFGAGGGTAFGTPAAFAEAAYRAEAAPRTALATQQMVQSGQQMALNAILPFFGMAQNTAALGIPQAQTTLQAPWWVDALKLGTQVAGTVIGATRGNPGDVSGVGGGIGPSPASAAAASQSGVGLNMGHWNQSMGGVGLRPQTNGFNFNPIYG